MNEIDMTHYICPACDPDVGFGLTVWSDEKCPVCDNNLQKLSHAGIPRHTDACLIYAARTGRAYCIAECSDLRNRIQESTDAEENQD